MWGLGAGLLGGILGALKRSFKYEFLEGFIWIGFTSFIFVFVVVLLGGLKNEFEQICSQCFKAQRPNQSRQCSCGGTLEPLSHWEWKSDGNIDA